MSLLFLRSRVIDLVKTKLSLKNREKRDKIQVFQIEKQEQVFMHHTTSLESTSQFQITN